MSNEMLQDDGSEQEGVIADINRGAPFKQAALSYLQAGWFPFPLKPMQKEPFATGVTGRKNAFPGADVPSAEGGGPGGQLEAAQIGEWLAEAPRRANIGVWLREDVLGIDVDAYDDRSGSETLEALEEALGKLPVTWISSARKDGISGIRFFRIPKRWAGKLQWSGKAGKNIDIIQTGHRFAGVWPSWNPDAQEMYQWYKPGAAPDGNPDRNYDAEVSGGTLRLNQLQYFPRVDELPELPQKWIEFLTRGYVERTLKPIDMESSGREIEAWAKKFKPGRKVERNGKMVSVSCREVESRLAKAKERIEDDSASHGQLVNGHWSLLNCGIEGHIGVLLAVKRFERFWSKDVLEEREKRGLGEANNELFRSRIEALRKIKGRADEVIEAGGNWQTTLCGCPDPLRGEGDPDKGIPRPTGNPHDPLNYEPTHDGMADFFTDLYKGDVHWVEFDNKWYLWNGHSWEADETGLIHRMFRVARDRMVTAGEAFKQNKTAEAVIAKQSENEQALDVAKAELVQAKAYLKFATDCANRHHRDNSIEHSKSVFGVSVKAEKFNQNRNLLGVANGVIELPLNGPAYLREGRREDLITMNTQVPYIPTEDQIRAGGELAEGVRLLENYRQTFVPDDELWEWLQICLASSIYGTNMETKIFFARGETRTGKSTIVSAVASALGQYSSPPGPGIFDYKELNPALASAMNRRFLFDAELDERLNMDANQLKKLSGRDPLTIEVKNSNTMIRGIPAFTIWVSTNNAPRIQHLDLALRERIMAIPFKEQVMGRSDRKAGLTELQDFARPAVLAWLVEGWEKYRAIEGLHREIWPKSVEEASRRFFDELSPVGTWANEVLIPEEGARESATGLFDAYRGYCLGYEKMSEKDVLTRRAWSTAMKNLGYKIAPSKVEGVQDRYLFDFKFNSPVGSIKTKKAN